MDSQLPGPEAVSFAAFQTKNSIKSDNLTYVVRNDPPFTPLSSPLSSDHTMEFLCRSWSPSALDFHQILTSQNLMLPTSITGGTEEDCDYEGKEEEKTYQRRILCNRYSDNTLHEPWGWLKGKTIISKFKLYRERKKQEVRLHTANLDAALSLTQLAAAIAGLATNMPTTPIIAESPDIKEIHVLAYDQDNMNDVVASAAALMTTVCAEVAESLGALRSRVATAVKSGLATRTPIDMITLTATAATCILSNFGLRGAATLKSRAIADTCSTRHQELLRAGAELFIIMPSGKQAFKWVTVYLKKVQVIFSFRKKYLQGVLTAMKEYKIVAVVEEKNIDQGYMFLCLKTKDGIIKLLFQDNKQFLIWASTISKLLKMHSRC